MLGNTVSFKIQASFFQNLINGHLVVNSNNDKLKQVKNFNENEFRIKSKANIFGNIVYLGRFKIIIHSIINCVKLKIALIYN